MDGSAGLRVYVQLKKIHTHTQTPKHIPILSLQCTLGGYAQNKHTQTPILAIKCIQGGNIVWSIYGSVHKTAAAAAAILIEIEIEIERQRLLCSASEFDPNLLKLFYVQ